MTHFESRKAAEASQEVDDKIKAMVKSGIPVTRAYLHQGMAVPAKTTESSLYAHKGIKMVYTASGLFCEQNEVSFIVPLANVIAVYP